MLAMMRRRPCVRDPVASVSARVACPREWHRGTPCRSNLRGGMRPVVAQAWKQNSAEIEVHGASLPTCWDLWENRPRIPQWMSWIQAVDVQENDPRLSRWTLETEQFGQTFRFSWLAKNLAPIRHKLIHWVSVDNSQAGMFSGFVDIKNKGEIQFRRLGPDSCFIRLIISYELPDVLLPLADVLKPTVDGILMEYMKNFETVALAEGANDAAGDAAS